MDEIIKCAIDDLVFDFYLGSNLATTDKLSRLDLILQSVFCYCTKNANMMNYGQGEYALLLLDKDPNFDNMFNLFGEEEEIIMTTFVARIHDMDYTINKLDVPFGFDNMKDLTLDILLQQEPDISFLESNLVKDGSTISKSQSRTTGTVGDLLGSLDKGGRVK